MIPRWGGRVAPLYGKLTVPLSGMPPRCLPSVTELSDTGLALARVLPPPLPALGEDADGWRSLSGPLTTEYGRASEGAESEACGTLGHPSLAQPSRRASSCGGQTTRSGFPLPSLPSECCRSQPGWFAPAIKSRDGNGAWLQVMKRRMLSDTLRCDWKLNVPIGERPPRTENGGTALQCHRLDSWLPST